MAEKVETILSRGVFSTRPRDIYDVYILETTQNYQRRLFIQALKATAEHRGSSNQIADIQKIISLLKQSEDQKNIWEKYRKKFSYAKDITYEQVINVLVQLLQGIS